MLCAILLNIDAYIISEHIVSYCSRITNIVSLLDPSWSAVSLSVVDPKHRHIVATLIIIGLCAQQLKSVWLCKSIFADLKLHPELIVIARSRDALSVAFFEIPRFIKFSAVRILVVESKIKSKHYSIHHKRWTWCDLMFLTRLWVSFWILWHARAIQPTHLIVYAPAGQASFVRLERFDICC